MTRTDFSVVNVSTANGMKGFTQRKEALKEQTIADIAAQPGVKEATPIYKNTAEDHVTYGCDLELTDETFIRDNGLTAQFDTMYRNFSIGDDGNLVCNVYGMEEASIARMNIREGEMDAHLLYEKMAAKEGVLVGVQANRTDMSLNEYYADLIDIGDIIPVYKNGQLVMELPVLAKAAINGDDQEIGYNCKGPLEVGGDGLYLYLPTNIYKELYDDPVIFKYSFNVEEDQKEAMTAFLDHYMESVDTSISYLSSQAAMESALKTRSMIHFVGGLIGMIFGFAGVLNLINTLITSILTRRHEFATMQSIGMTKRQLTKMLIYEGMYYALSACLLGVIVSAFFNLTLVRGILASMWQFTFQFTLLPAFLVSAALLIISAVVPILALKLFHKGSIVEQLRISE